MNFISQVKQFVKKECQKADSHYGLEPFECHFASVVKYARELAQELGGDEEVVTIAAWLHDIGSIVSGRKDHHLTGAKIAENFLEKIHYPKDKIILVKKCILNHRGSTHGQRKSLEEKIVAEADTLSAFESLPGLFKAALVYEKMTQIEARVAVREKLERKWRQLYFPKSKELVRPQYEAMKILLK